MAFVQNCSVNLLLFAKICLQVSQFSRSIVNLDHVSHGQFTAPIQFKRLNFKHTGHLPNFLSLTSGQNHNKRNFGNLSKVVTREHLENFVYHWFLNFIDIVD